MKRYLPVTGIALCTALFAAEPPLPAALPALAATPAAPRALRLLGLNRDPRVDEISGAALSLRDPTQLWVVNDSDDGAVLHAISRDGSWRARVRVVAATATDWEDLSSFQLDGQPYLLIADTGDNGGLRDHLSLLVVGEPRADQPSAAIAWQLDFRLPEGPRDIEAVAVDGSAGSVYLIAKRHFPRVLYRLPLRPAATGSTLLAERVGSFDTLPAATAAELAANPKFGRFQGDITGLALDPQGRYALVLSYRGLYFYPRFVGQSWLQALSHPPQRLSLPPMPQAEGLALDGQQKLAIVLSERLLAPIYQVVLPAPR